MNNNNNGDSPNRLKWLSVNQASAVYCRCYVVIVENVGEFDVCLYFVFAGQGT